MHGEDLPVVFLPRLDGEFIETDIEKFHGTIAAGYDALILVGF